jgi:hypothetical protein
MCGRTKIRYYTGHTLFIPLKKPKMAMAELPWLLLASLAVVIGEIAMLEECFDVGTNQCSWIVLGLTE